MSTLFLHGLGQNRTELGPVALLFIGWRRESHVPTDLSTFLER